MGRFINADVLVSTGQGILGNNMFAYCLNNPISGIDASGRRTYFINGISNENETAPPQYSNDFAEKLSEKGVDDVKAIAVYNGQIGMPGILRGIGEVFLEMLNCDVYTALIIARINEDLAQNPLSEGEQLNLIGYSGGGQLVLNVVERLDVKVDNVILIGTPVAEALDSQANVYVIWAGFDPLSWNVGFGFQSYFAGWISHTDYFNATNIDHVAEIVSSAIK